MAPNDVWMLTVKGLVLTQQHLHTLHFKEVGGESIGPDLVAAYQAAALTAYRGCFSTADAPALEIEARKVCGSVPLPSPTSVTIVGAGANGTRFPNTDPCPSFLACTVAEKGEIAGRRYSGRFFLGGLYEVDLSGNIFMSSYIDTVQAYINALTTAFITPPGGLAWRQFCFSELLAHGDTFHTKRNPNPPYDRLPDPVDPVSCELAGSPVRAMVVNWRPTTMRSRKLGHGI